MSRGDLEPDPTSDRLSQCLHPPLEHSIRNRIVITRFVCVLLVFGTATVMSPGQAAEEQPTKSQVASLRNRPPDHAAERDPRIPVGVSRYKAGRPLHDRRQTTGRTVDRGIHHSERHETARGRLLAVPGTDSLCRQGRHFAAAIGSEVGREYAGDRAISGDRDSRAGHVQCEGRRPRRDFTPARGSMERWPDICSARDWAGLEPADKGKEQTER